MKTLSNTTDAATSPMSGSSWCVGIFRVVERLNKLETQLVLLEKDMIIDQRLHNEALKNTDRI